MIKTTRWRSCLNTPPKNDGYYLVVNFYKGELSYAACLHYTTMHGWNTHRDEYAHKIVFKKENEYDRTYRWTEMTNVKDKRK